jgi:hypothetical protein
MIRICLQDFLLYRSSLLAKSSQENAAKAANQNLNPNHSLREVSNTNLSREYLPENRAPYRKKIPLIRNTTLIFFPLSIFSITDLLLYRSFEDAGMTKDILLFYIAWAHSLE